MSKYELKYLKYKEKYFYLKKQLGGEWYYNSGLPIKEITNETDFDNLELGKRRFKVKDVDLLIKIINNIKKNNKVAEYEKIRAQEEYDHNEKIYGKKNSDTTRFSIIRDNKINKQNASIFNIKVFVVGYERTFGDITGIQKINNDEVVITYNFGIIPATLKEKISQMGDKWFFVKYNNTLTQVQYKN